MWYYEAQFRVTSVLYSEDRESTRKTFMLIVQLACSVAIEWGTVRMTSTLHSEDRESTRKTFMLIVQLACSVAIEWGTVRMTSILHSEDRESPHNNSCCTAHSAYVGWY